MAQPERRARPGRSRGGLLLKHDSLPPCRRVGRAKIKTRKKVSHIASVRQYQSCTYSMGACVCLWKQRRLVLYIYLPSAIALATVGSLPARVLPRPAVPKRGCGRSRYWFVLEWCLVTCWRFFLRFSSSSPLPLLFFSAYNKNL